MNAIFTLILSMVSLSLIGLNENELASEYIEKYKELAISEMHRTGIPASIKLAQGIHESGMGRSRLALNANNHFGIKCGSSWDRKTYYIEDDDYRNGKKIKSCFRHYSNAGESYVAHSDFLSNSNRYANLFTLGVNNYEGWAYGLKKAGYATDPKYAEKIIRIIQDYNLYEFDNGNKTIADRGAKAKHTVNASAQVTSRQSTSRNSRSLEKSKIAYNSSIVNHTDLLVCTGIENMRQIAKDHDLSLKELQELNPNLKVSTSKDLEPGTLVYLEKKKISYKGKKKFHVVLPNENMQMISDKYAIQLTALYLKNRMPKEAQPFPGEKIFLKGMIRLKDTPSFYRPDDRYARDGKSPFND